jgi:hypothetical protein
MDQDRAGEIAQGLERRGLAAPARLLLEAHRPLRPLLAETAAFLSPVLRPLFGQRYAGVTGLLEDEGSYDELIDALDDAEHR